MCSLSWKRESILSWRRGWGLLTGWGMALPEPGGNTRTHSIGYRSKARHNAHLPCLFWSLPNLTWPGLFTHPRSKGSAPPTTFLLLAPGSSSVDTWTTSLITCSSVPSTLKTARPTPCAMLSPRSSALSLTLLDTTRWASVVWWEPCWELLS